VIRALLLPLLLAAAQPAPDRAADEAAIRHVIADMEAAWNRGDFRGYMAGFENPGVVFVSRGRFQDGWQGTLDHYICAIAGAAIKASNSMASQRIGLLPQLPGRAAA
jgi:ketosteroid isomerase-like protein